MVTVTLHDKDAKSLLEMVNDESDLLQDERDRIAAVLKCALALCDCGQTTTGNADALRGGR